MLLPLLLLLLRKQLTEVDPEPNEVTEEVDGRVMDAGSLTVSCCLLFSPLLGPGSPWFSLLVAVAVVILYFWPPASSIIITSRLEHSDPVFNVLCQRGGKRVRELILSGAGNGGIKRRNRGFNEMN